MARFIVKSDGFGRPRAFDTRDSQYVAGPCPDAASATALVSALNERGSAPMHDNALPDQLNFDTLQDLLNVLPRP